MYKRQECDRARRKAETKEDFLASINVIEQQGNKMNTLIEQLDVYKRQGLDRQCRKTGSHGSGYSWSIRSRMDFSIVS